MSGGVALRGLIVKELRQIRADPRLLPLLMVAPIIQLIVFGYAATLDVATARVVVVDDDATPQSRDFARRMAATGSFEVLGTTANASAGEQLLARGDADLAVIIPSGYGRALAGDGSTGVQLIVDGTDSTAASVALAGAAGLVQALSREEAVQRFRRMGAAAPPPMGQVSARSSVLYNPELRSRVFMIPGVLAMVLLIVTTVAASMAIVREKELGTLEQLVVTPVSRATLLAAKLIPFAIFGLIDSLLVVAVSRYWFEVPFRGSLGFLLLTFIPFLANTLGIGLFVSTVSRTQQQAMMTAMFLVMLPMIYLSGFIFPVESMPKLIQPVTEIIPLRHFLLIIRGVMLKGVGWNELWPSVAKLSALGVGIFGLALALFRKRVD